MVSAQRSFQGLSEGEINLFVQSRQEIEDHLSAESPVGTEVEFVSALKPGTNIQQMLVEHYRKRGWHLKIDQDQSVSTFLLVRISIPAAG